MAGTKKVQPKKAAARKAAPKRAATKSTRESMKKGGGGKPTLVSDPIFTIQI